MKRAPLPVVLTVAAAACAWRAAWAEELPDAATLREEIAREEAETAQLEGVVERAKDPGTGPLTRAIRGAKDIVICPLEIPATVRRVADERDPFFAIWAGTLEGFGNGLVRLAAGIVELGTSPLPGSYFPLYNKRLGERARPPTRPPMGITRP